MDAKELTRIFWNNVDSLKKTKGMTWEDLEAETEHSARSIATMKTMNKAPSFHFALAIAKALGTTVEDLASETNNKSLPEGTMGTCFIKYAINSTKMISSCSHVLQNQSANQCKQKIPNPLMMQWKQ